MNLNPISVADALVIVGAKLGLSPEEDRGEVLEYLNRIRSIWYHQFHRKRLFDDWLECVPVTDLCMDCVDSCCACYRGFSLPLDMAGPVSAWASKSPMNLRSRWREKFTGRWATASGLNLVELPGVFATSRDIVGQFKIRILAGSEDDCKSVTMRVFTCEGEDMTLGFKTDGDSWVEIDQWVSGIKSILLPALKQKLQISAELEDGTIADIDTHYPGAGTSPVFRRFKVKTDVCDVCSVYVQANRRFKELVSDNQIVEIGDRLVLEHGASYFKNAENTIDTKEIARGDRDLAIMVDLIKGMVSRERGDSDRDGAIMIRGRRTRSARLPGRSGRRPGRTGRR